MSEPDNEKILDLASLLFIGCPRRPGTLILPLGFFGPFFIKTPLEAVGVFLLVGTEGSWIAVIFLMISAMLGEFWPCLIISIIISIRPRVLVVKKCVTFDLRSRPNFRVGILASAIGEYSSGMSLGVSKMSGRGDGRL